MRRLIRFRSRKRRAFLEFERVGVQVEGVDRLASAGSLDRVAVLVQWGPDNRLSRSVSELANNLVSHDYPVVLVSASDGPEPMEWPGDVPENVTVLRRSNVGYDFGSWAVALDRYPAIAAADQVLLVNDSLAGPFAPIDHLFKMFDATDADVWGLTDSSQLGTHHLQSYCMGFKHGCLQEPPLAKFWHDICIEPTRDDIIHRYEIGLSRLLHREHFSVDAAFRHSQVVRGGDNPTIHGWRQLLDLGLPFVKRQLLRQPELTPDGSQVRAELQRRFGVDADDWV
jgi:lipopolysaccharide biosynthesis protein